MVKGFRASAVAADIKGKGDGRLDMAAIVADAGASAAGVFTRNAAAAAPVHLCRERLRSGMATAVLVNSGNANCMTGTAGKEDAVRLCRGLGKRLDIPETTVLPCSTGVIGVRLPVARMESSLNSLVRGLSSKGLGDVSRAILTTDTVPKTTVR
ncbi:MAG: bifunctional ornithine acetyltransferase/N-acetylglutamate synthase [bacterium]|nr:MAG: bifunctional ornithine acetyltransferase/N-acetylglutamate synthase [bacterium]